MKVDHKDGRCRRCGGSLEVTDANDATMTVECDECGECYLVQPDAFRNGSIEYFAAFHLQRDLEAGGDAHDA